AESFLLTEPDPGSVSLGGWLAERARHPLDAAGRKQRRQVVRAAAALLRTMHEAGCFIAPSPRAEPGEDWLVRWQPHRTPVLGLASVEGVCRQRRARRARAVRDLFLLRDSPAAAPVGRTDRLRFLQAYFGQRRLTPEAKRVARALARLPVGPGRRTGPEAPAATRPRPAAGTYEPPGPERTVAP